MRSSASSFSRYHYNTPVPLHEVPEQVHDLFLKGGSVLNDGVSFVGHLLLKFLQLLDLLTNLELRLCQ